MSMLRFVVILVIICGCSAKEQCCPGAEDRIRQIDDYPNRFDENTEFQFIRNGDTNLINFGVEKNGAYYTSFLYEAPCGDGALDCETSSEVRVVGMLDEKGKHRIQYRYFEFYDRYGFYYSRTTPPIYLGVYLYDADEDREMPLMEIPIEKVTEFDGVTEVPTAFLGENVQELHFSDKYGIQQLKLFYGLEVVGTR